MALLARVWPRMVFLLLFVAMFDLIQLRMVLCDLVWSCMTLYDLFMVFFDKISSLLAVIDQNSFGLVW